MKYTVLKNIRSNREIISDARKALTGHWHKAALTVFLFSLFALAERFIDKGVEYSIIEFLMPASGAVPGLVVTICLAALTSLIFTPLYIIGIPRCFIGLLRGGEVKWGECVKYSFVRIGSWYFAGLLMSWIIVLKFLLLIIPGILATYDYMLVWYCLADDPQLGVRDALRRSRALMYGHRWQMCCLGLRMALLGILGMLALLLCIAAVFPLAKLAFLIVIPAVLVAVFYFAAYCSALVGRFYLELLPGENDGETVTLPATGRSFTAGRRVASAVAAYLIMLIFMLHIGFFFYHTATGAAAECDDITASESCTQSK